jgi:hypothetical protein
LPPLPSSCCKTEQFSLEKSSPMTNSCQLTWAVDNDLWQVKFVEERVSFLHFLTNVCAIAGGNYSPLFAFSST